MRRLAILLVCCGGVLLPAAEDSGDKPMPGLGPAVVLQPLLPRPSVEVVNEDERALRQLEALVQRLDIDIDAILARYQGMRPATKVQDFPELENARQQRDASWEELQGILNKEDVKSLDKDLLDTPGTKRGQDIEERRLQAQNSLSVIKCLYELGTGVDPDPKAIEDGRTLLKTVQYEDLPIADRPFVHYFRFAFTLQQARLSSGATRANLMQEAKRHRDLLRREFPDSYLSGTADSLLANGDFSMSTLEAAEPDSINGLVPKP